MNAIVAFLKRHSLPDHLSLILGKPFVYVFHDGDEWAGIVTGIQVGRNFAGLMIETSGWDTDLGTGFVIEEVDVPVPHEHEGNQGVHVIRKKTMKKLQLASIHAQVYYEGEFTLVP